MTPIAFTDDQLRCVLQAAKRVSVSARDEGGREPGGGNLQRAIAVAQSEWSRIEA